MTRTVNGFEGYFPSTSHKSKIIDSKDLSIILSACTNIRYYLLICLMSETGIRIGEALGLRYAEDIDLEHRLLYVRYRDYNSNDAEAKYAEERCMSFSESTYNLLMIYMSKYAELLEKTDYLFVKIFGKSIGAPLSVHAVYRMLERLEKRTGIHVTNHTFRHFFAEERRKAGWSIELISHALGHKSIATTQRYLHITDKELVATSEKYFNSAGSGIDFAQFL